MEYHRQFSVFFRRWRELCATLPNPILHVAEREKPTQKRRRPFPPDIIDLLWQHGAASSVYFARDSVGSGNGATGKYRFNHQTHGGEIT